MTPDTSTGSTFHQLCAERGRAFPLLTERLLLNPFTAEDLHEVWEYWLSRGSKFTVPRLAGRRRLCGAGRGAAAPSLKVRWTDHRQNFGTMAG
ncbi:hypothetical protein [Nesterenkonia sp. HG001]|uniref:hypothetical protein n=1 Tax=Nesterenkonia sp. HG001 TaxID=2983207 RepID=UPI002AC73335|nr:hypothetical protein [Nesterenkonia sp. HG001]MDZ5076939.1 hypothetical protein [Nesterenkonia sp. HG001]